MPRKHDEGKSVLSWIVVLLMLGAITLAIAVYGLPKRLADAGSFASFIAAVMTPVSLILLVLSLSEQEKTWRRATDDNFRALQVQSLIALIEDDRYKLAGLSDNGQDPIKKKQFSAVLNRYKKRLDKLNDMLKHELRLPTLAGDGGSEQ